jgi:hypothetical protein
VDEEDRPVFISHDVYKQAIDALEQITKKHTALRRAAWAVLVTWGWRHEDKDALLAALAAEEIEESP